MFECVYDSAFQQGSIFACKFHKDKLEKFKQIALRLCKRNKKIQIPASHSIGQSQSILANAVIIFATQNECSVKLHVLIGLLAEWGFQTSQKKKFKNAWTLTHGAKLKEGCIATALTPDNIDKTLHLTVFLCVLSKVLQCFTFVWILSKSKGSCLYYLMTKLILSEMCIKSCLTWYWKTR